MTDFEIRSSKSVRYWSPTQLRHTNLRGAVHCGSLESAKSAYKWLTGCTPTPVLSVQLKVGEDLRD